MKLTPVHYLLGGVAAYLLYKKFGQSATATPMTVPSPVPLPATSGYHATGSNMLQEMGSLGCGK